VIRPFYPEPRSCPHTTLTFDFDSNELQNVLAVSDYFKECCYADIESAFDDNWSYIGVDNPLPPDPCHHYLRRGHRRSESPNYRKIKFHNQNIGWKYLDTMDAIHKEKQVHQKESTKC